MKGGGDGGGGGLFVKKFKIVGQLILTYCSYTRLGGGYAPRRHVVCVFIFCVKYYFWCCESYKYPTDIGRRLRLRMNECGSVPSPLHSDSFVAGGSSEWDLN